MELEVKGRIGDRLVAAGALKQEQLEVALNEQRRAHRPLGQILTSLGFVRPEHLAQLVAEDLGVDFVRARDLHPDPVLVAALDASFVREAGAFPLELVDGSLRVAMVDPGDPDKVSLVRQRFPYPLQYLLIVEGDLNLLVRKHLVGQAGEVASIFGSDDATGRAFGDDFPVERLTHALIADGIHRGATDIHIEPEEKVTRVRYRVDGLLCPGENLPRDATDAIISRVKVLSRLDIAERRRPQDGRMRLELDGRKVDIRVSLMPCTKGENVVLRILDATAGFLSLPQLGIGPATQSLLARIADRPHGLFLVTGPTGSGKTTTLYAMLGQVDALTRNVATVEDPVEYDMPLLRQSQVDPSIGYGFHEGLRSLLRQDPDVVLVGEVRDPETANMAVKASMTGHLVFSTLHTNTALGAVPRLHDLGVDHFLIEDTLIGVLAQRLVRRVCEGCAEEVAPTPAELEWLGTDTPTVKRGAGCEHCGGTGLSGRTAIHELFLPDETVAAAMRAGADLGELHRLAVAAGFRTMTDDGREKVRQGLTTMHEVERVNRSHRLAQEEREDV